MNLKTNRIPHILSLCLLGLTGCATTTPQPTHEPQTPMLNILPASASDAAATTSPANPQDPGAASASLVGKKCRLQFRRDALGLNAPGILEPTAISSGGKAVSIVGTVEKVDHDWVVLRVNRQLYWVPTPQILLLEAAD